LLSKPRTWVLKFNLFQLLKLNHKLKNQKELMLTLALLVQNHKRKMQLSKPKRRLRRLQSKLIESKETKFQTILRILMLNNITLFQIHSNLRKLTQSSSQTCQLDKVKRS
jgi:hypothetical protein